MFVEDLDVLLADFGVTATLGAASAQVLLNAPDQGILGEMQISAMVEVVFKSSDFSGIKRGDTLTVGATGYTVREVFHLDDGAFKKAELKR